ncbi:molybdenum cofactor biosynthesis protein MoaE [Hyphobacterium sp. HN65]|uniref:Molybdopterin synthase catalytic subunit n=1 Tax=Hyphobacterium lacteum TaxID=3116575 RepID=A0ABU7LQ57_9PROT|nr:molybdenum cofactor biosynthesis protein MoaE [Hyphobacterium sp. HN65]MEE2525729.1 molybdenum cofactor biosynthesis protein MoaE [Hyphobacterium sp. HN65]
MTRQKIILTGEALDIGRWSDWLAEDPACGAVAGFTGLVRAAQGLEALELQHHPVLTLQALERIARDATGRFGLAGVVLAHRHGRMAVGTPIVHIACACGHRRDALAGVSYMIDMVKTRAPFWKREWRTDGPHWIEPTQADHEAARRWMEEKT